MEVKFYYVKFIYVYFIIDNYVCIVKCLINYFINGYECIKECLFDRKYVFNNICNEICLIEYNYK